MPPAPYRFSETAFRRYESCIASVVNSWPDVVSFSPAKAGLSLETFTCRLRDAMTGFARYGYVSSLFDKDDFFRLFDDVVVATTQEGLVLVGPRATVSRAKVQPIHAASQQDDVFRVVNPTAQVFDAFCVLLSERLLGKPLVVEMMDPQLLLEAQEKYDIDVSIQQDGSTLIV